MNRTSFPHFGDPHVVPSEAEVRAQLNRILASADFPASARNRRFLAHVVDRSLHGEKTSGYEVATKVFGRPASFNPVTDPIVRIEATKLRRDLETYYLKSGREDRVRIALPKGSYRAVFAFRAESPAVAKSDALPAAAVLLLRASLLGWSEDQHAAGAAWASLCRDYPDLLLDPRLHSAMEQITGRDENVRTLLLQGLRRAARQLGGRAPINAEFDGHIPAGESAPPAAWSEVSHGSR